MDWIDLCRRGGANADIASNTRMGATCRTEMIWVCQRIRQTQSVTLKKISWNVAGLSEDSTDIFLLQISMLTDWDVSLLQ